MATYICQDCAAEHPRTEGYRFQKRCDACKAAHEAARWTRTNQKKAAAKKLLPPKQTVCADCAVVIEYRLGKTPTRCKPCSKAYFLAISSEQRRTKLGATKRTPAADITCPCGVVFKDNGCTRCAGCRAVWRAEVDSFPDAKTLKQYRESVRLPINRESRSKRRRARYLERRELELQQCKQWAAANRDAVNAKLHRRRARVRDAEGEWSKEEWRSILDSYGHTCPLCGDTGKMTVDHIVPIAHGGSNWPWNLAPLCKPCNTSKNDRWIAEFEPWNGLEPRPVVLMWLGTTRFRNRKLTTNLVHAILSTQEPANDNEENSPAENQVGIGHRG